VLFLHEFCFFSRVEENPANVPQRNAFSLILSFNQVKERMLYTKYSLVTFFLRTALALALTKKRK